MDEKPRKPGEESLKAESSGFHNSIVLANDRHHAFVKVVEGWTRRVVGEVALENLGHMCPHLDGRRGDAGNDLALAVFHAHQISSEEDMGVSRDG